MKTLITKAAATAAGIGLFCVGCLMAGLGFAVLGVLALFALAAAGLALLAAPFLALAQRAAGDEPQEEPAAHS